MAVDRALLLQADAEGLLRVIAATGFPPGAGPLDLPPEFPPEFAEKGVLIANRRDRGPALEALRRVFALPCFLALPVPLPGSSLVLVVGREREILPFYPPFDAGDVANLRAIAGQLGSVLQNMALWGRTERMASSFRRFVPETFLRILNRAEFADIRLGDQVARRMGLLVCDMRSFTTLSERMSPEQVFAFVNDFLAEAGPVIRDHGGFVSKYTGDGVMALFEDPTAALPAGVALIRRVEAINAERRRGGRFAIQIGVGVNIGDLMLGTIGEAERLEASVLSDAVNLCFRLESLTKEYGAQLLTTDATLGEAPEDAFVHRPVDLVTVKGRRNHITVVEILDALPEDRRDARLATRDQYVEAFQNFEFGNYDDAARGFRAVAKADPDDRAARLMAQKAARLAEGDGFERRS